MLNLLRMYQILSNQKRKRNILGLKWLLEIVVDIYKLEAQVTNLCLAQVANKVQSLQMESQRRSKNIIKIFQRHQMLYRTSISTSSLHVVSKYSKTWRPSEIGTSINTIFLTKLTFPTISRKYWNSLALNTSDSQSQLSKKSSSNDMLAMSLRRINLVTR